MAVLGVTATRGLERVAVRPDHDASRTGSRRPLPVWWASGGLQFGMEHSVDRWCRARYHECGVPSVACPQKSPDDAAAESAGPAHGDPDVAALRGFCEWPAGCSRRPTGDTLQPDNRPCGP